MRDQIAFGQSHDATGRGVVALDLRSGKLGTVTRYQPEVSGLGALAVDESWVVWEQLDSKTNLADWSVHAANRTTGENVRIADSHGPGGFLPGQQPLPVLRHGSVAWAQPVLAGGGALHAELRVFDLARRTTRVLDSGRLSSPVYAGGLLVWAKVDDATRYSLHAVDEVTLQPVELPPAIQRPKSVAYLGGSADRLVWSSGDSQTLEQWDFNAAKLTRYTLTDRSHVFQFLQVAGDYLLWYGGTTASVLDLTTGAAFDTPGTVAGSAQWIVNARPGAVIRVPTAGLPHLSCPA
ncbi:hypothetical protein [Catellatospora sp. TT07R-123]|uniref:hypothetical protein n=1 Tax=Catellatospora sp. TT07R-123 TaxID=2733863 RepID=UPI001BB318C6|nr:hypothetical protein [Catellatospora sp. TT07R-123]